MEHIRQIGCRQLQIASEQFQIGHDASWQELWRSDVLVEQCVKPTEQIAIALFTCDELPLIEPRTVVEQQLYVAREDGGRMAVDLVMKFGFNVFKTASHRRCLSLRQVEGFLLAIGEERIVVDVGAK